MLSWLLACRPQPADLVEEPVRPVCDLSYELLDAPDPIPTDAGQVAPVDLLTVVADSVLDLDGVTIDARATFLVGEAPGRIALELAPDPVVALLDGQEISWQRVQVGDPAREVLVLNADVDRCSEHVLEVSYSLPIGWLAGRQARLQNRADGVFWSAGLEDATAGNFLGMWMPSNLLFDRFDLTLALDLPDGHDVAHTGTRDGDTLHWTGIQAHTPFWVVSPTAGTLHQDFVAQTASGPITVEVYALADDPGASVESAGTRAVAALEQFSELFGPYAHGDRYVLWIRDDQFSSMEYDGATVTAMGAIEHEIMHSWYARGASPLTDADGWVDEAITAWVTDFLPFRHHPVNYDLDPTLLRHGHDGWDGPRLDATQYVFGSAIFADIAWRYSVDETTDALGAFYRERAGASYTDVELEEHLTCWFDDEVRAAFFHQAYGQGPAPAIPETWCDSTLR